MWTNPHLAGSVSFRIPREEKLSTQLPHARDGANVQGSSQVIESIRR